MILTNKDVRIIKGSGTPPDLEDGDIVFDLEGKIWTNDNNGNKTVVADTANYVSSFVSEPNVTITNNPENGSVTLDLSATSKLTPPLTIAKYIIDWGDGNTEEVTSSTVSHAYTLEGVLPKITVKAVDSDGNIGTKKELILNLNNGTQGSSSIELSATNITISELTTGTVTINNYDSTLTYEVYGDGVVTGSLADNTITITTGDVTSNTTGSVRVRTLKNGSVVTDWVYISVSVIDVPRADTPILNTNNITISEGDHGILTITNFNASYTYELLPGNNTSLTISNDTITIHGNEVETNVADTIKIRATGNNIADSNWVECTVNILNLTSIDDQVVVYDQTTLSTMGGENKLQYTYITGNQILETTETVGFTVLLAKNDDNNVYTSRTITQDTHEDDFNGLNNTIAKFKYPNISESSTTDTLRVNGKELNIGDKIEIYKDNTFHELTLTTDNLATHQVDWSKLVKVGVSPKISSIATGKMKFSPDGTKAYIKDNGTYDLKQYPLSTPWDISTLGSPQTCSYDYGGHSNKPDFSPDGTKMYMGIGSYGQILVWSLDTPWDLTTVADTRIEDVKFRTDDSGIKYDYVFLSEDGNSILTKGYYDNAYQINLSNPYTLVGGVEKVNTELSYAWRSPVMNPDRQSFLCIDGIWRETVLRRKDSISGGVLNSYNFADSVPTTIQDELGNYFYGGELSVDGKYLYIVSGEYIHQYKLSDDTPIFTTYQTVDTTTITAGTIPNIAIKKPTNETISVEFGQNGYINLTVDNITVTEDGHYADVVKTYTPMVTDNASRELKFQVRLTNHDDRLYELTSTLRKKSNAYI